MNVRINLVDMEDGPFKKECLAEADRIESEAERAEEQILSLVRKNL